MGPLGFAQDSPPPVSGTLSCVPDVLYVGEIATCTFTMEDSDSTPGDGTPDGYAHISAQHNPSGLGVSFNSSSTGFFDPWFGPFLPGEFGFCTASATLTDNNADGVNDEWSASCSVTYRPDEAGTHSIYARMDTVYPWESASTTITALARDVNYTGIACNTPLQVGVSTQCELILVNATAASNPPAPDGTVTLASDREGAIAPCSLTPHIDPGAAICQNIPWTPSVRGTHTLSAINYADDLTNGRQYNDAANIPSYLGIIYTVNVQGLPTTVAFACPDDDNYDYFDGTNFYMSGGILAPSQQCTATVTASSGPGITGSVSITVTGPGGFSVTPNPCTLTGGTLSESCSFNVSSITNGIYTLSIEYSGDSVYEPSSTTFRIYVDAVNPTVSHSVGSPSYPAGCSVHPTCYINGNTPITIVIDDPLVDGVSSGIGPCTIQVSNPFPFDPPSTQPCTAGSNFLTIASHFPNSAIYTISVLPIDNVSNSVAYSFDIAVDNDAPLISINSPASGSPYRTGDTVTITADISESGPVRSGLDVGSVVADLSQITGNPADTAVPPTSVSGSTFTWTVTVGPVPDGSKTFTLYARDNVQNLRTASRAINVDNTAPTIGHSVGSPSYPSGCTVHPTCYINGNTPITVTVTDNLSGLASCTVTLRLAGPLGSLPCGPGDTTFDVFDFTGLLPDQQVYTFEVVATDAAGNTSTYTFELFLDLSLPTVAHTVGTPKYPAGCVDHPLCFVEPTTPLTVTVNDTGSGLAACTITVSHYSLGSRSTPCASGSTTFTIGGLFAAPIDGAYAVEVTATDNVTNTVSGLFFRVYFDDTPPSVLIRSPAAGTYFRPGSSFVIDANVVDPVLGLDPGLGPNGSGLDNSTVQADLSQLTGNPADTAVPPTATLPGGDFTWTVLIGSVPDGPKTFVVSGRDNMGNLGSATRTVNVDGTAPTLTLTVGSPRFPASCDGISPCYVTSATSLTLQTSDPVVNGVASGLASCSIAVTGPGGSASPACTISSGTGSAAFTLGSLGLATDGTYTLTFTAQDAVGNSRTVSYTLYLDDTQPNLAHTVGSPSYPAGCSAHPDCYITSATPLTVTVADPPVNGVASGLAGCSVTITGPGGSASPACAAGSNTFDLGFHGLGLTADGLYTLTVQGQDNVGNNDQYSFDLFVDNTAPTVTITAPAPGSTYAPGDTFSLTAEILDPTVNGGASGLDVGSVVADLSQITGNPADTAVIPTSVSGSTFTWTVTVGPVLDGSKTITLYAQDNVDNGTTPATGGAGSGSIDINTQDTDPPTITHTVGSPRYPAGCSSYPGCYITPSTTLTVTMDDPGGIASCSITVTGPGGSASPLCDSTGTPTTSVNPFDLGTLGLTAEGVYTVDVTAQDQMGNASNYSFEIYLDPTPPGNYSETLGSPSYTDPGSGTVYVTSSTPFAVNADDGTGSGIQGCTLQIDGGSAAPYSLGDTFTLPTPDGPHSYTVTCTDNLGNTSSFTRSRAVDDTPPTIADPVHTNATCYPNGNCDAPPELVQAGTYVKALDQASPFVPASTFAYPSVSDGSGSGVQSCTLNGTQSDGLYTVGTDFRVASGDGRKTFSLTCEDNLGNAATNTSPEVIVDDTPPTIAPSIPGSPTWPVGCQGGPPNCYVTSATTLRFTVQDPDAGTDPGSGFTGPNAGCTITVTGPGPNSPSCTVLPGDNDYTLANGGFATDGVYTNYVEATDSLGNYARSSDLVVVLDNTPPQISKEIPGAPTYLGGAPAGTECEGDPGTNCYVSSLTTLRVTILDPPAGTEPGSGFASCAIQATGQHYGNVHSPACAEGDNDFALPASLADDRYLIAVTTARDNLGNTSSQNPLLDVILDNTAPTIGLPVHTNATCWPLDRCDLVPELVVDGTWVKAQDQPAFDPENPWLPSYPFVPRSTFAYRTAEVFDEEIAPGLPGSGIVRCTLSGGTTGDGPYTLGTDFSLLPGDGVRSFSLSCEDNVNNVGSGDSPNVQVDDTPPEATFVTAGPRYDDPTDGTIFVKTTTVITPVLTDAGVGVDLTGYTGSPTDGPPGSPPCEQNIDRESTLTMPCLTPFTFPPPDRDHHFWIVRPDKLGNVAESRFVFFVDDTPPDVTLLTPALQEEYLLRERVIVRWEVTDDVSFFGEQESPLLPPGVEPRGSGIREVIATTPNGHPLDTTSVGAKIFTVTAIDNLGHSTTVTVTYRVVYAFSLAPGLQERVAREPLTVQAGAEVSIAFRLQDALGEIVPDAEPVISLANPATGEVVRDFRPDNRAAFDVETGFYAFVFSTEGLSPGEYEIWIQPGDTTTRKVRLQILE